MSDLLGMTMALFIGGIRLLRLGENNENQMIERLTNILEAEKIKNE